MKNNKKSIIYFLAGISILFTFSCKKDFNEVNTDPLGQAKVKPEQLMTSSLVNILGTNMVRNRNFNNELMQVTVDISDAEGKVFRYDLRRTLADYTWNNWYVALTDIKDIYTISSQPATLNKSYQGISLILQAWVYQLLTDTYGDVPYTQANKGHEGIYEPVFDRQKDIYADLIAKLNEANELLKPGTAIVATSDPVYNGDVSKWRRLGNSLRLRLLLRISGKAEVSATAISAIKEMIDTNPANYPLIQSSDQTAKILWNGTESSTDVYSSPFMVSVRPVDFRGVAICDFFLGKLVTWGDPRVDPTLGTNSVPRWAIGRGTDGYVGVPSGYAAGIDVIKQAYFYSQGQLISGTTYYPTLQTDKYTGIIMNSAEVYFILAEAAAKGWITGNTAASYYDEGMFQAINYWLPTYTKAKFTAFQTAANLEWKSSLPLDNLNGGNSQMEMIHQQKYYANFLVDFQQWFEYRRTQHPILPTGTGLVNGGRMPARLFYPIITQSTNPTNYKNAVELQGADGINTYVWWQKP
jgi:Starch-binding associating with outer membrane